jgi:hypothetical protein
MAVQALGHYRILNESDRRVGSLSGVDERLGTEVALKVLLPDSRRRNCRRNHQSLARG